MTPEEVSWTVDGLKIAGLSWGPADGRRILALHGWLDHAGSFIELAPRLPGARVVALDLSGHGHSDHRSPDATYAVWDDIPQILGVLDALGWNKCTLLGHSRGAMFSLLTAALRPERVDAVVALDALMPPALPEADIIVQMRKFLDETARAKRGRRRHFATAEEFIERRSNRGHPPAVGRQLMERAIVVEGDVYRVRADPRLHAASPMKLSAGQIEAVFRAVEAPVLCVWARDGLMNADWVSVNRELATRLLSDYREVELPGHHHWHLEPGPAMEIAAEIIRFLELPATLPELAIRS